MTLRFVLTACAALLLVPGAARADGTITHLSGAVSVAKAGGAPQAALPGAKVSTGDTVITGAAGYVRLQTSDGGEMVLRPESRLEVKSYRYTEAKPEEDSFVFGLIKGGLRTVTGLIGKRGNRDAYRLETLTATIGIRGTQFDLRVCQADCGALNDGTYLAVRSGAVRTANDHGGLDVAAGQVAHVSRERPPALLPRDPGIGFTPPPTIPRPDEKKRQPRLGPSDDAGGNRALPAASAAGGNERECVVE